MHQRPYDQSIAFTTRSSQSRLSRPEVERFRMVVGGGDRERFGLLRENGRCSSGDRPRVVSAVHGVPGCAVDRSSVGTGSGSKRF